MSAEVVHASQGYVNKTARQIAADEVAKIVAGAPESLDTLKEIAELIANGDTGIQALFDQISTLKDLVSKKADTAKLHALTPEVTDGKVILKPVDGKANWVGGTVGVKGVMSVERSIGVEIVAYFMLYNPPEDSSGMLPVFASADVTTFSVIGWDKNDYGGYGDTRITVRFEDDVDLISSEYGKLCTIPAGTVGTGYISDAFDQDETIDGRWFSLEEVHHGIANAESLGIDGELMYTEYNYYYTQIATKSSRVPHVTLPGSTGNARRFSLALTTDVTAETDVAWEGGDIIEAFPGAKNLVPSTGEIVFDVKEIAPGKMLVNRVPGASGGAVTLTAPNGRVAELTVGDDLVLEVKEV